MRELALTSAVLPAAAAKAAVEAAVEAPAPAASRPFDDALDAPERNHRPAAFAPFVRLAGRWPSAEQVDRWTLLWGCGGDATSAACQLARRAPRAGCGVPRAHRPGPLAAGRRA